MLHRASDLQPAMGAVVALLRQRENGPVHDIFLRNLPRERHTGQTKRPSHCDDGLRTITGKKIAPASFYKLGHQRRLLRTVLMSGKTTSKREDVKRSATVFPRVIPA